MQCKTTHTRSHIFARRLPCHCDVQTLCLHKYVTTRPPSPPSLMFHFLKAPEDRCYNIPREIFSLKFTKYRLAAGGAKALPQSPTCNRGGPTSKGTEGDGRGGEEPLPHPCKTSSMPLWCPNSLFAQKYATTLPPSSPVWWFISWKAPEDRGYQRRDF